MLSKFMNSNTASTSGSGTLPSNTITNPKVDLKGITTRSGVAYQGPTIPTTCSSLPKEVEGETEPVVAPVSAPMPNLKSSIPYPLRRNDERRREKANDQIEKFYKIFKDLSFEISLTDALILMPKFASTLKALIGNKEKLSEMARTPLNEHCSAVILNKLPEKLGDPDKFLIPCDFPRMDECLALADLGASINLMSLSAVEKKLSLSELTPTCMTLELADRSITQPIDHNLWDVIVNSDLKEEPAPTGETSAPPAPRTAKQLVARRKLGKELRSILLLEYPVELLICFTMVYEDEMRRSSSSTSTSQNLAFLSSENTSSTNEVSTASRDFRVSTAGGISQISSTSCAHDVACSFFAQPTTSPQLENEDFQQIDEDDLEELDLRWQVAMLTVRVRKFIQKTGRNMDFKEKRLVSLDKSKIECYNYHRKKYGQGIMTGVMILEIETNYYALMAISSSSSSSSSNNEVQKCSKQCLESFKTLQKNYDSEREKHSRARLEIQGYELALESLESRILVHEKNELAWGEKYEFQNYELKCREIKINNLNLELEKVVKERDELKLKIEKWEESSKNLDELLNS
ncbi:hypothetical protein Tco_0866260 [Tanacetum coccineum]